MVGGGRVGSRFGGSGVSVLVSSSVKVELISGVDEGISAVGKPGSGLGAATVEDGTKTWVDVFVGIGEGSEETITPLQAFDPISTREARKTCTRMPRLYPLKTKEVKGGALCQR